MDEYRSKGGMDLIAALEKTRQYAVGPPAPVVESIDRKNAEAMAQLENMMKGVR